MKTNEKYGLTTKRDERFLATQTSPGGRLNQLQMSYRIQTTYQLLGDYRILGYLRKINHGKNRWILYSDIAVRIGAFRTLGDALKAPQMTLQVFNDRTAAMKAALDGKREASLDRLLTLIASEELSVPSLVARNADSLDFYDVSVWTIEAALRRAYEAGRNER